MLPRPPNQQPPLHTLVAPTVSPTCRSSGLPPFLLDIRILLGYAVHGVENPAFMDPEGEPSMSSIQSIPSNLQRSPPVDHTIAASLFRRVTLRTQFCICVHLCNLWKNTRAEQSSAEGGLRPSQPLRKIALENPAAPRNQSVAKAKQCLIHTLIRPLWPHRESARDRINPVHAYALPVTPLLQSRWRKNTRVTKRTPFVLTLQSRIRSTNRRISSVRCTANSCVRGFTRSEV